MLGTHNSGSFGKQIGWTKLIPKCLSRCQRLTLREQYDLGVRFFDIRITYYKGEYILAHGMVRYNLKLIDVIKEITSYPQKCLIGIIIEDTFLEFKKPYGVVISAIEEYRDSIVYITSKKTGTCYYDNKSEPVLPINWACPTSRKWDILIPEVDCKDINRLFKRSELIAYKSVYLLDFIETIRK